MSSLFDTLTIDLLIIRIDVHRNRTQYEIHIHRALISIKTQDNKHYHLSYIKKSCMWI